MITNVRLGSRFGVNVQNGLSGRQCWLAAAKAAPAEGTGDNSCRP